jgi:hypothetical protein
LEGHILRQVSDSILFGLLIVLLLLSSILLPKRLVECLLSPLERGGDTIIGGKVKVP